MADFVKLNIDGVSVIVATDNSKKLMTYKKNFDAVVDTDESGEAVVYTDSEVKEILGVKETNTNVVADIFGTKATKKATTKVATNKGVKIEDK